MKQVKKVLVKIFEYGILIFTIIVSVFPIIWVIMSAFKTNAQILGSPFSLPTSISFDAFIYLFEKYNFLRYALNSLLICITSTGLSLIIFAMGGYVIAKYKFPGRNFIFALFTITLLVPAQSKAQPIFSLIMNLNLYDNIWGVALVYLSAGLAMSMFILKSTFMSIPKSLDEAAAIEGAGFFTVFWRINLPLAKSGLVTAGILMFLNNWNEYFYASLLTSSDLNRTLPLALQFFNEAFSYDYTKLFAALTVVVLPGIILYAFAQEQVQESIAASGVKG
ncbi:carbohydrate ABC transporter permease [uncultured Robinsoniella sp.]|uniref:carbohydrate ABC transporter permease n=1 Tax=uncultured Robinsoniella sp. TaxID=904190 RepID=UPI00374FA85E